MSRDRAPAQALTGALTGFDPWLVGADNGVVDLRTEALRAGSPDDRITMHTAIRLALGPGLRARIELMEFVP